MVQLAPQWFVREGAFMSEELESVVVDTNFFLHCLAPAELPWADLTPAQVIRLLVTRPVQRELDKLKQSGSDRRADRARAAAKLMRQAIAGPVVLREAAPRVTLELLFLREAEVAPRADLDASVADDHLVLIAGRESALLLSGDTGVLLSATHAGVRSAPIPDSWGLPGEANRTEVRLREVERRVRELEMARPAPELQADLRWQGQLLNTDAPPREIMFKEVARPRPEDLDLRAARTWAEDSEVHAARRRDSAWIESPPMDFVRAQRERERVRSRLEKEWAERELKGRTLDFGLTLINAGSAPASSLHLSWIVEPREATARSECRLQEELMQTHATSLTVSVTLPTGISSGAVVRLALQVVASELMRPAQFAWHFRAVALAGDPFND